MKFLALAALAVVAVSAEACTEDELANEETPKCDVTTTEGEGDDAVETVTCTESAPTTWSWVAEAHQAGEFDADAPSR